MREFINDISQLAKKYWTETKILLILVLLFSLYLMLPRILLDKPKVYNTIPSSIMQNTQFSADNRIVIEGENLNHVIGVFINGIWEPNCYLISVTENQIDLQLPTQYYAESQELEIQVETRINSELTALSNKAKIEVLSIDSVDKPVISNTTPTELIFDGNLTRDIVIKGENFNDDSMVVMEGKVCETSYENGCLYTTVPFSAWFNADGINVQVVQYYNEYPTTVKSKEYFIKVNGGDLLEYTSMNEADQKEVEIQEGLEMTSDWFQNSQIMKQYLDLINNDRYALVLSVKDESSLCLTGDVQNSLYALGLEQNLFGALQDSYLAVIDGGEVLYENLSEELIQYDGRIDDVTIHAESAGFKSGNISSIQLNGVDYSPNQRGMNIVVYDKETQEVVDSVCFDVYDKMKIVK